MQPRRLRYLNLFAIRLPLPGVLSILHRVSGALLILALPFALAALHYSVSSAADYARVAEVLSHPLAKLVTWGVVWALLHHLCAGIRFLLLDFHLGTSLPCARMSAALAFAVSIFLTLLFGVWLW